MYSSFSKKFRQIKPYDNYNVTDVPWHEAMVAGNGRLGVLESCAPIEDSLIYQNVEFVMPSEEPRHVPYEVTSQLEEARQSVINFDDTWNIHDRKRTNMYCYHPGHMIRLTLEGEPDISGYRRWTDYKTGTINTTFKSDGASVSKSTYVSRKQNVIITKIISEKSVNMSISIDDFESMPKFGVQKNNIPAPERNMLYSRFVRGNIIGTVVHYPEYEGSELAKGGFAGVTRILTDGDMRVSSKPKDSRAYTCIDETAPVINISHAESITLITYTDWTDDLGEYCEFRDRVNGKNSPARTQRGYVVPETTIQGCRFGVSRPGGFVLHHGVWIRSTKRMGSDRFPDRRFLLRPCRLLRDEDGYLCFRPYRQCRPVVFE